ncbi:MAG: hypothetical protein OXE41_12515 [Gammaproteobacteria bacterium]|nr:hypothetical protein [Gammaproteobacteria bacterium]
MDIQLGFIYSVSRISFDGYGVSNENAPSRSVAPIWKADTLGVLRV